jgi:hypothetical protein
LELRVQSVKAKEKDSHILEIKDLLDQAQEDSTLLFPEIYFFVKFSTKRKELREKQKHIGEQRRVTEIYNKEHSPKIRAFEKLPAN